MRIIYQFKKKKKQVATVNNRRNRILKIMEKWSNRHVIDGYFVLADRDAQVHLFSEINDDASARLREPFLWIARSAIECSSESID